MLDLNKARVIFADHLQEHAGQRHSLDAALMAACEWAYRAGLRDADADSLSRRLELQASGLHPAPCAGHCEANAYQIEIRRLRRQVGEND